MTLSSKNLAGYALAVALLGLITWMSTNMLTRAAHKETLTGTIEVTPVN